jgi:hypothetical protein
MRQNCKVRQVNDVFINDIIEEKKQLEEENIKLKEELNKSKTPITNNNITNNNTNNVNNNNITNGNNTVNSNNKTVNINLVAYGKEDLSVLTKSDLANIMDRGYNCVTELLSRLNFNPDRPQYHNVFKSNLRDNYLRVFDGNDWNVVDQNELIDDLISNRTDDLNDISKELRKTVKSKEGIRILDKFDRCALKLDKFLHKLNAVRKDIKLMMYNKKNMIIETMKNINKKLIK